MVKAMIDFYRNFMKYDDHEVYIAFHKKTMEPYFHAKQVCQLLEYTNDKDAIRVNVDRKKYSILERY